MDLMIYYNDEIGHRWAPYRCCSMYLYGAHVVQGL